ncbi:MAG: heparan-alpha-glucosaminide N-acetyltransferase domain-containing protein [Propionibacteriaceae bacterium]|nr:heparan-alpha-glucosaminide N-acetyltransferase domain-containing protein [Propionibacteriaceae bacterium]
MTTTAVDPSPDPAVATEAPPRPARTWWPQVCDPRRPGQRVRGLDAARGLAVLGMVVAHTVLTQAPAGSPAALLSFANGRSAILFATIAGVSLAIMSGGRRRLDGVELMQARLTIVGRAIVLLLLAGALSLTWTSVSVILASYAFWFILALPALRWRTRTLLVVAACHAALGSILATALPTWFSFWGGRDENGFVLLMLASSTYPALVWLGFVLAGLALGRHGLDNVTALRNFLVIGLVMFIGFALPFLIKARSLDPLFASSSGNGSSITENAPLPDGEEMGGWCLDEQGSALVPCTQEESEQQLDSMTPEQLETYNRLFNEKYGIDESAMEPELEPEVQSPPLMDLTRPVDLEQAIWGFAPHSGTPFENFSSGGLALATIAGLVLLGRLAWSRFVLWPLTGVGAMALTAYVVHVLILGSIGQHPNELLVAGCLALGLVVLCSLWLQVFTSGPLEQITGAVADRLAGRPVTRRGARP